LSPLRTSNSASARLPLTHASCRFLSADSTYGERVYSCLLVRSGGVQCDRAALPVHTERVAQPQQLRHRARHCEGHSIKVIRVHHVRVAAARIVLLGQNNSCESDGRCCPCRSASHTSVSDVAEEPHEMRSPSPAISTDRSASGAGQRGLTTSQRIAWRSRRWT
jgi:hypothetical protein